jgi:hypothetical protein
MFPKEFFGTLPCGKRQRIVSQIRESGRRGRGTHIDYWVRNIDLSLILTVEWLVVDFATIEFDEFLLSLRVDRDCSPFDKLSRYFPVFHCTTDAVPVLGRLDDKNRRTWKDGSRRFEQTERFRSSDKSFVSMKMLFEDEAKKRKELNQYDSNQGREKDKD